MPTTLFRGLLIGSVLAMNACGTARLVHRDPAGGVLELEGDRGKAMEQANQEMAEDCGPNNFTIMREGEETVGTATVWRVHYQCGSGQGVGIGAPPSGEPPPPPAAPPPPPPTAPPPPPPPGR